MAERERDPGAADTAAPPGKGAPPPAEAAAPAPRAGGRLRRAGRWIRERYCTIDVRTLGLFRLVLGALLVGDCLRHWAEASWIYSNDGVLTNHFHLFRPSSGYNFSLYHAFSSTAEVHVAFALSLLCFFCFFIGWHTRLFSILSFLLVTSRDNRIVMIENGGYVVVNLITCWAMFMPTGRRFSVDALLRSFRERRERTAADLADRSRPAWAERPYVSGIVLLAILNLATIYYFNVVNKSGQIWRRGETVHYVLHLDRMVTGIAVFARELLPFWATKGIAWAVLVLEALLVTWILSPYGRRLTRPLAMAGMWALHGSFGVMMRLGPFSWFMIAWSFLLPTSQHWDALERWYRRRAAPRVVVYDGGSPLAFALMRLLVRLDRLELLRFEEARPAPAAELAAAGGEARRPELFEARDPRDGRVFQGAAALREILRALPGGRFARPVVWALTLGAPGALLGLAARRRDEIARFFGLGARPSRRAQAQAAASPSPLAEKVARGGVIARETLIAYLGLCAVSQAINENKSVPAFLKHTQPKIVQATIVYPRLLQGWGMFAPNPITDDGSISVDAITVDGRHVDPFTGLPPDLDLTDARGLGLGQIQQDYFNRIRLDRNKVFRRPGLQDYLLRYHERTGRPEDEIVAFDVYWVRDQCPKPGERAPYKNEAIPILSYRKPGYRPRPGLPPLPPALKERSAGN
ncbi:hypothetical protein SOCEGT47_077280 [Sorangium cellulosum]|uniref:HTTM-like domain-containing protein n=1 Tax=Sorangium cellulosum TaxID=56 RepID=A0A4P2QCS0_SORCE|nr:HTTM domain-containing protein [Sorangium cellulosum]AUX27148.1 hypothetical protein SOCEGT47_077280 [Sorangium cellulosum]